MGRLSARLGRTGAWCSAVLLARIFGGKNIGGKVPDGGFRVGCWQSVPEIFLPSNVLAIPPEITGGRVKVEKSASGKEETRIGCI